MFFFSIGFSTHADFLLKTNVYHDLIGAYGIEGDIQLDKQSSVSLDLKVHTPYSKLLNIAAIIFSGGTRFTFALGSNVRRSTFYVTPGIFYYRGYYGSFLRHGLIASTVFGYQIYIGSLYLALGLGPHVRYYIEYKEFDWGIFPDACIGFRF